MKNLVLAAIAIILFLSGCGTKELSSNDVTSGKKEVHQHESNVVNASPKLNTFVNINQPSDKPSTETQSLTEQTQPENTNTESKDGNEEQMDESVFLEVLNKYNNMLDTIKSDVNNDNFSEENMGYKFETIQTKEQLYDVFSGFMTTDAAGALWNEYVNQSEDGLYLIPRDGYPLFTKETGYTIEKIDQETYRLVHNHDDELHGKFDMIFTFKKFDGNWKITEIEYQRTDNEFV
ncbi:hypothetical protein [Radiobacillus sp. PE A8.2]|uniref:hypothetical protein n=1 Tax=Radiobacillus sp. PE A8.2 TaxID=3380349 RepID=UPI00388FF8A8